MTKAQILSLLIDYCNFKEEITEETFEEYIITPLLDKLDLYYTYGATKAVIIPADTSIDYVIKIPFSSYIYNGELHPFTFDYCRNEQLAYEKITEEYKDFLLPVEKIGTVNGYPIYAQPKAEIEENNTEELVVPATETPWYDYAIEYYGKEKVDDFLDYCRKEKIVDIRAGNIGYFNDKPVIIDYGGYYEPEAYDGEYY